MPFCKLLFHAEKQGSAIKKGHCWLQRQTALQYLQPWSVQEHQHGVRSSRSPINHLPVPSRSSQCGPAISTPLSIVLRYIIPMSWVSTANLPTLTLYAFPPHGHLWIWYSLSEFSEHLEGLCSHLCPVSGYTAGDWKPFSIPLPPTCMFENRTPTLNVYRDKKKII